MPAPTNIDFANAIDIGSVLPYSTTQDVRDSGTNYTVYYKYTAQAGDIEIGLFGFGELSPGYQPIVNVYLGPAGAPTAYLSSSQITAVNKPIQVPVTPGSEYFFEFISFTGNAPTTAILTLLVSSNNGTTWVNGDILINDDTDLFPTAILDGATGAVKLFKQGMQSGEQGQVLPSGIFVLDDQYDDTIAVYDADLNEIIKFANPITTGGTQTPFSTNKVDKFYFGTPGSGAQNARIGTISDAGVVGGTTWTLPTVGLVAIAVNLAETILYHVGQTSTLNAPIKRWDLIGNAPLSDLVAAPTGTSVVGKDLLYLDDDTILAIYKDGTSINIYRYDTAGVLLNTYNVVTLGSSTTTSDTRLAHALDDPNSFWVWIKRTGGISRFVNVKVSDGSVITQFDAVQFEEGQYQGAVTATPTAYFGHSESCPFFLLRVAAPTTGTITVIKATDPTGVLNTFDFTTTGGLSPATFTLGDTDIQEFTGLAPGTYGVTETPVTNWDTSYNVSNGNPHDAIVVGAGDNITVIVTNTRQSTAKSGIYKIVPDKRQDTLWVDVATGETEDVKIPDPFFKTAYIGD